MITRRSPPQRRPTDWAAVHRHLERLQATLDRGREASPEQVQAVLDARARALAAPLHAESVGSALEVIEFRLGEEAYAIESAWVAEVFPLVDLTCLPGTPDFVLGIVNVRGEIVSVVDLGRFFGLPEQGLTDLNKVILLTDGDMLYGILADRVEGVRTVDAERLQPSLPTLTDRRRDYLKGIAEGRLVVLDAHALLTDPRMIVHQAFED